MAKFYRDQTGAYGLRHGQSAEIPIPEGAEVVEFDESTNPELLASLGGQAGFRWQDHTIVAGVILRSGLPVTINAPRVLTDVEELSAAVVALALLALDEVNDLRQWITSFKAAVAGAGTLAALKTAVAALPNTPDRTRAQLLAAVRNKLSDV